MTHSPPSALTTSAVGNGVPEVVCVVESLETEPYAGDAADRAGVAVRVEADGGGNGDDLAEVIAADNECGKGHRSFDSAWQGPG